MNVLSLFDGISCGRIALERAGIKVDNYFSSEIDKYAIQVANKNWAQDIPNRLGDVKNINGCDLPKINLLVGGSPCQSFSFCGKRKGMSTKDNIKIISLDQYIELKNNKFDFEGHSYLFWEFIRLLHETKPKYFLLENVKMAKEWQDVISKTLEVEPIKICSSLVSAQNRQRLYWTNIPNVEKPQDKRIFADTVKEDKNDQFNVASTIAMRDGSKYIKFQSNKKMPTLTTFCGNPNGLGRPFWAQHEHFAERPFNYNTVRRITPVEAERLQTLPDNYTDNISDYQRYKCLGNGWTVDVIAHIFKNIKQ